MTKCLHKSKRKINFCGRVDGIFSLSFFVLFLPLSVCVVFTFFLLWSSGLQNFWMAKALRQEGGSEGK